MSQSVAIVSGSDAGYFDLLEGLLRSIDTAFPPNSFDLCLFDVGITDEQRSRVEGRCRHIVAPEWTMQFPGRDRLPQFWLLSDAKPRMPKIFPGYDVYVWLDADLWVQDGDALDIYVRAARRGTMGITAEYDRAYKTAYKRQKLFGWTHNHKHYRLGFGWRVAEEYGRYPVLNGGAFSAPANSPLWRDWAELQSAALLRSRHRLIEQVAMNLAIYRKREHATLLPAYCNWLLGAAMPWIDENTGLLVEPNEPHQPLGLVHLAGDFEHDQAATLRTIGGRDVRTKLGFDDWTRTRAKAFPGPAANGAGGGPAASFLTPES